MSLVHSGHNSTDPFSSLCLSESHRKAGSVEHNAIVKLVDLINVRFARLAHLEVSVRSGGHSYTCTSIKVSIFNL